VDPGRAGFTLLEILVVVSIMIALASIAVLTMTKSQRSAREKASVSQLDRLRLHLDSYREITGRYPPDGMDSTVQDKNGEVLRGSAALRHALTQPLLEVRTVGNIQKTIPHEPVLPEGIPENELSEPDPDSPGPRFLVDAFKMEIFYDNTEDGKSPAPEGLKLESGDPDAGVLRGRGYTLVARGLREALLGKDATDAEE
jgi:hypothetical protein